MLLRPPPPALALLALLALAASAHAKTFSRCGLARALKSQGFPGGQLSNWVCLVESESGRNTAARGGPNRDGSYDYGLFQINSRYWCRVGHRGGDCNMRCEDLLNDNISDDSKCAKKIYKRHGFRAWVGWTSKCKGKRLPDISKC